MNTTDSNPELPWTASVGDYVTATSSPEDVLRHRLLLPAFAAFLGPLTGARILDVGCGGGTLMRVMHQAGAHVTGLDVSDEMLRIAARQVPAAPLHGHDLTQPLPKPLANGQFDGITANLVFQCLPQIATIPSLLAPALRDGGWLALSILHPAFHCSAEQVRALKQLSPTARTWSYRVDHPYLQPCGYEKPVADSCVTVRNWHRPLREYFSALVAAGMVITALDEPLLSDPLGTDPRWFHATLIPRFLFIRARLERRSLGAPR